MSWTFTFEVLILGLVLSADSFSAAVAMGTRPFTRKDAIRFGLASGGAEGFVTLVGYLAGAHIIKYIAAYDHWIAFLLLFTVAIHMAFEAWQGWRNPPAPEANKPFHSFLKVIVVSFATSLDAFGVGISLGLSDKPIFPFIISIGLFAFVTTILGLLLARKMSGKLGPAFTFFGALVLTYMAFEMLKI